MTTVMRIADLAYDLFLLAMGPLTIWAIAVAWRNRHARSWRDWE